MPVEEAVGELAGMMEAAGLTGRPRETGIAVRFYVAPMQNEERTKKEGRPIFDDTEMCEIRVTGSLDKIVEVVADKHKYRFPDVYAAFKKGLDQDKVSGFPLAEYSVITRSQVEELRYFGVRTVEQLADITDGNLMRLGAGWLAVRAQARDWLAKQKDAAILVKLRTERDEFERRIGTMEKMLAAQAATIQGEGIVASAPSGPDPKVAALEEKLNRLIAAAEAPAPKRRGRPPKAKPEQVS